MSQIYVVEPVNTKLEKLIADVVREDKLVKLSKGDMINELIEYYRDGRLIK